jgi:hypothetical protein
MRNRRRATTRRVRTTGRRSTSPLLDRTSRASTSGASTGTAIVSSSCTGWSTNRRRGGELPGTSSTSHAWSDDERAPVSTFALMDVPSSSGKVAHSRQPITVGTVMVLKH